MAPTNSLLWTCSGCEESSILSRHLSPAVGAFGVVKPFEICGAGQLVEKRQLGLGIFVCLPLCLGTGTIRSRPVGIQQNRLGIPSIDSQTD